MNWANFSLQPPFRDFKLLQKIEFPGYFVYDTSLLQKYSTIKSS